jgi:DNA-binding XRE family transcriptional regulator
MYKLVEVSRQFLYNIMDEKPNPLIFALVCLFSSASWLGANSIWVEMSVFVQHLPEGWKLGSVLDIVIQVELIFCFKKGKETSKEC